jgi:hypothetical protein
MLPDLPPQLKQRIRTGEFETRMSRTLDLVRSEGNVDLLPAGCDIEPGLSAHITHSVMKGGSAKGSVGIFQDLLRIEYRESLPRKSLLLQHRYWHLSESKSGAVECSSLVQGSRRNRQVYVCNAGDTHDEKLTNVVELCKLWIKKLSDEM